MLQAFRHFDKNRSCHLQSECVLPYINETVCGKWNVKDLPGGTGDRAATNQQRKEGLRQQQDEKIFKGQMMRGRCDAKGSSDRVSGKGGGDKVPARTWLIFCCSFHT
jgi:hypothetical protein